MERGEVPLAEMAAHFSVSVGELVNDIELAAMCGLPPYQDELVDVFIDDDTVFVGVPRLFTRPLRLTAPEGFALLTATQAAMQLPGADPDGPLARALAKLAAVLGPGAVVVDAPAPPMAESVAAAAANSARVRIVYWSAAADQPSEREITPRTVFVDRGHWYVIADDHRSSEQRIFRIDRIERCEGTGVVDQPRVVPAPGTDDWFEHSDLPVASVRLGSSARWVVERYPVRSSVDTPEGLVVELTVAHERWLAELLVRLGGAATVLSPAEWVDLGPRTARELLRRYHP
jgi:proteasome accessory factor C